MDGQRAVVIVGSQADGLSNAVASALRRQICQVIRIAPENLADLSVSILGDTFTIDQQPVGAILFRASPDASFSTGFIAADRNFSDTETRAIWLAAMHLDSVIAVNRYDAEAWFGSVGWVRWRQVLQEANVPVAPFAFGDVEDEVYRYWYPYASTHHQPAPNRTTRRVLGTALATSPQSRVSLAVCSQVVNGETEPAVTETARLLYERGIRLASIATDKRGHVLTIDTLPEIKEADLIDRSAEILTGFYYEHLRRW